MLIFQGVDFRVVRIGTLLQFMDVVMTDGSTKEIGYVHPLSPTITLSVVDHLA